MENADAAGFNTLSLREETLPGGGWPQEVIAVDGRPLEAWLGEVTGDAEFNGLYPSLGMNDMKDQRATMELAARRNVWMPLLVCADDMDLSCSVVSAYVQEADGRVWWSRFGWGVDGEKEISAPPLCFAKAEYERFVEDFLRQAALHIASVENPQTPGPGMELDAESSRRTTPSAFVVNLVAWAALVVLVIVVIRFLWG